MKGFKAEGLVRASSGFHRGCGFGCVWGLRINSLGFRGFGFRLSCGVCLHCRSFLANQVYGELGFYKQKPEPQWRPELRL